MDVSVVIPTWNRADQVLQAINSVINQSVPPAEILVVDDGSEDDTAERVLTAFPKVRLLRQANLGVSRARNRGITEANGEWIAFLDSDDTWLPDKLAKQMELLRLQPDLLACHTEEIWIRNGRRVNPMRKHAKPAGWIFTHCLPLCCVSPSSVLLHRSIFESIGNFDESLPACEDYDLWLRVFQQYPIGLVDTPLVTKYGGHADQLSRRYWGMDRFRVTALEKMLRAGQLTQVHREECIKVLQQKCEVLIGGFEKRGKSEEAQRYRHIKSNWTIEQGQC